MTKRNIHKMHHHKRHLVSRSSKQQAKDKRRNIAKVFKTSAIANRDRIPQVWFLLKQLKILSG